MKKTALWVLAVGFIVSGLGFLTGPKAGGFLDPIFKLGRAEFQNLGSLAFSVGVDPSASTLSSAMRLRDNTGTDIAVAQSGQILLQVHNKAFYGSLISISTGAVLGVCSDCTTPYSLCTSTGTLAGQSVASDGTACH